MSQRKDTGLNTKPWPILVDHYTQKSGELGLTGRQIIDGVSRSLLCIALTFGANNVGVEIEGVGTVKAKLISNS